MTGCDLDPAPDLRVSFAPEVDPAAAVRAAIRILRREGLVVLDDLIDPGLLARCWTEIEANYPDLAVPNKARNYGPHEGRHCMPMTIAGALAEPAVLLPAPVREIAREMLEPEYKVDSVGLLVAIPGAPDQKRHADAWLFPGTRLDRLLPPFALAFATPLVTVDETNGRTAFWRGTHRTAEKTTAPEGPWDYAPALRPGSSIVWDFRVWHAGLANHTAAPRPMIFTVLAREWWIEIEPAVAVDYRKLKLEREVFDGFSAKWRQRFRRALIVDQNESTDAAN